jgi:hypothetical protein
LGEGEVRCDFDGNELGHRGHKENAVYRKEVARQVVQGC